ncbi:MAG: hypothetical protein QXX64_01285 [Nitrososphaera sp.]
MLLTEYLNLPLSQTQVDFIIPDIDQDRRLCIDPFLFYKSKDPKLQSFHTRLLDIFNTAFRYFREDKRTEMDKLIDFPEVNNIALGYSNKRIKGSGMGGYLNRLVADTLTNSSVLLERGLKHIEELQLVSVGIGPDRISDMVANILKQQLVEYTFEQCEIWGIPVERGVPLSHIFDLETFEWYDGYVDLPTNPKTGLPLLFVPRRVVRILPWINFEDYERNEYRFFLNPKKPKGWSSLPGIRLKTPQNNKDNIIIVTQHNIHLLDNYVARKEQTSSQAEPQIIPVSSDDMEVKEEELIQGLKSIQPGQSDATKYQKHMLGILNHLFEPELTNGKIEEPTIDGTERRDIVFTNESERSFWQYVRQQYSNYLVMFEAKNVYEVNNQHINQVAAYMGDRIGRFAIILTRNPPNEAQIRKIITVFNDSIPRKVILIIHDSDVETMLRMKERGENPTKHIQQLYREFKLHLQ